MKKSAMAQVSPGWWRAASAALVLALASAGLWVLFMKRDSVDGRALAGTATSSPPASSSGLRELVELPAVAVQLRAKLATAPDNGHGWALLGRTYTKLGMLPAALDAFAVAIRLRPADADLHVEYADTLAAARGSKFDAESRALVERALVLDPGHVGALSLAGLDAYEQKDYRAAVVHWERVLASVPTGDPVVAQVRGAIAAARQHMRP